MKRIPKDLVRESVVKNTPPAPEGFKKHYDRQTGTVEYVPKTPREQLRENLRKYARPTGSPVRLGGRQTQTTTLWYSARSMPLPRDSKPGRHDDHFVSP